MAWLEAIPSHEDSLEAVAGSTDLGHAWVNAALASGCSLTSRDKEVIAAATGTRIDPNELTFEILELRSKLDRFVAASVFVHEETHFYQLISTPYGRLVSEIERYFVADIVNVVSALGNAALLHVDVLPLRDWVVTAVRSSTPDVPHAALLGTAYLNAYSLKACLEGSSLPSLDNHPSRSARIADALDSWPQWLCAQDRAEGAEVTDDYAIKQTSHPSEMVSDLNEEDNAVPTLGTFRVSPREIFEGVALLTQIEWIRDTIGSDVDLAQILRVVNPGLLDPRYLVTRRLVTSAFPNLRWPARRAILLALSDLAFWGPTHRDYLGGSDSPVKWEDVHPGFRFVRSLEVLGRHRVRPTGTLLNDYEAISEIVCADLMWPRPPSMVESYLHEHTEPDLPLLADDLLAPVRRRAALARVEEPLLFIDGTNEAELHEKFELILPFMIERGHLRMKESQAGFEILFMAALSSLARDAFRGDSLPRLFDEPADVSGPVHESAMRSLFGGQADLFMPLTATRSNSDEQAGLGWEIVAAKGGIDEIISTLRVRGLDPMVNALRRAGAIKPESATDWYAREPAIAKALASLRNFSTDGSFTVELPRLLSILRRAEEGAAEDLAMLLEDVGMDYFVPELQSVFAYRRPSSESPRSDAQSSDGGSAPVTEATSGVESEQVVAALVYRAAALSEQGRFRDALDACEDVVERFGERPESGVRELVAMAMFNKAVDLTHLGRIEEEVGVYDSVVARLNDAHEPVLRRRIAKALFYKGRVLGNLLKRPGDAVVAFNDVVARFGDESDSVLREHVAEALFYKGVMLSDLHQYGDAIATFCEVATRFRESSEVGLAEQVGQSLFNKGILLRATGNREGAVVVLGDLAGQYGDSTSPKLRKTAADAMFYQAVTLGELGRSQEEIAVYDALVARFANDKEAAVRQQAIAALDARTQLQAQGNHNLAIMGETATTDRGAKEPRRKWWRRKRH
jgi:tetratricopeptide (TPR) repeat protein